MLSSVVDVMVLVVSLHGNTTLTKTLRLMKSRFSMKWQHYQKENLNLNTDA